MSQGAAPEESGELLGFDPDDSLIVGDEKEAALFYDASDGKAVDPADPAVQAKAEELEALEEELEFGEAEEEEAVSRWHAEARARDVMSIFSRQHGARPEEKEDCNWSVSLFVWALLHNSPGFRPVQRRSGLHAP